MRPDRSLGLAAVAALFMAGVILLAVGPASAAPPGSPWGAGYFPNVPLVTQDGETVRFYDDLLKGKAVAINLIYTSCKDTCPLETARLAQVQQMLGDRVGKDIFFYSISIDPKRDTPTVLKAYMAKFHVGPGWTFLTGKKADIDLVGKKLGLTSRNDADNPDGHMASLMVGNEPTGQWMRQSAVDNPGFLATKISNFLGNWTPGKSYAEARPLTIDGGQHLFHLHCAACHTLGRGDKIGPDLLGVTGRRDRTWLARFIAAPDKLLAAQDPLAMELFAKYRNVQMPTLHLGEDDVAALLKYLDGPAAVQERPGGREAAAH